MYSFGDISKGDLLGPQHHRLNKISREMKRLTVRAYLETSRVDTVIPRHSNVMRPIMARAARKRVLVRKTKTALQGGNLAFADFHVTPPFGNNIFVGRRIVAQVEIILGSKCCREGKAVAIEDGRMKAKVERAE